MATLTITDRLGASLAVALDERSGLARYVRLLRGLGIEGVELESAGDLPLGAAPLRASRIQLVAREPLALGGGLALEAGPTGWVVVLTDEAPRLPGPAGLELAEGTYAVGAGFTLRLDAATEEPTNVLALGFGSNATIDYATWRIYRADAAPVFREALREVLAGFTIPATVDDLRAQPPGTIATVEGRGTVELSGEFDVGVLANPLAAADLPAPVGPVRVVPRATVAVEARVALGGGYQVRSLRDGADLAEVTVATGRTSELALGPSVSAGVVAGSRRGDLLARLTDALSEEPAVDGAALAAAGLSGERIAEIEEALARGLARRFELAALALWSSARDRRTVLRCAVELGRIDSRGEAAVAEALRGRIGAVERAAEAGAPGLRVAEHATRSLRRAGVSVRASLLGLVNHGRLSTLLRDGAVLQHPGTGDWIITDRARAQRVTASSGGIGERARRLRRLVAESVLMTAVLRGAGAGAAADARFELEHEYVEQRDRTSRQVLEDDLDVAAALGLLGPAARAAVGPGRSRFGAVVFAAFTRFDQAAIVALFERDGAPRPRSEYESAGRRALALLVREDEEDAFRRRPAVDDALWDAMRAAGPFHFAALPPFAGYSPARLAAVIADYAAIAWWATAMESLSERVVDVRLFLAANPAARPGEPEFERRRGRLQRAAAAMLRETRSPFGDPWGMVALALAAGGRARAAVEIVGPEFELRLPLSGMSPPCAPTN